VYPEDAEAFVRNRARNVHAGVDNMPWDARVGAARAFEYRGTGARAMTTTSIRAARQRARRRGMRITRDGDVFSLVDAAGATILAGDMAVIEGHLARQFEPRPTSDQPGGPPPAAWARVVDDYMLSLAARRATRHDECASPHPVGAHGP
jgi:hypothetical protein